MIAIVPFVHVDFYTLFHVLFKMPISLSFSEAESRNNGINMESLVQLFIMTRFYRCSEITQSFSCFCSVLVLIAILLVCCVEVEANYFRVTMTFTNLA